jgi:glycosyltransferase involved in cell wall biosynthesis
MVAERYLPDVGGTELQLARLAEQLTARGVRVEIVTPRFHRHLPRVETSGAVVHRLWVPPVRYVSALTVPLALAWFLLRHVRRFETVHVHTVGLFAILATAIGRAFGRRVVLKAVGWWELERGVLDPARRDRAWVRLALGVLRRASVWIAVSGALARAIAAAGIEPARIRHVPNGVDTRRFAPGDRRAARAALGLDAAAPRAVFAGRLEPVKALPTLLRAWRAVVDEVPDATLDLVGAGTLEAELRAERSRLGLDDRVVFHGRQPDVVPYLRAADVFVLPSSVEGLSNTLLEAMAVGRPVVATRVSGTEDMVDDGVNGLLVPPGDAAALAGGLLKVLTDPEGAALLGWRARADVTRRCSLDAVAETYRALYAEAMP